MSEIRQIVDCHVNIWDPAHYSPAYLEQIARVRPGELLIPTDADSIFAAMELAHKVIVFSPRYGDSVGIQGEDSTVVKAIQKYPDKFVGFAYFDPREEEALEKLNQPIYPPELFEEDKEFVIKKFGLNQTQFDEIMNLPRKKHTDFATAGTVWEQYPLLKLGKPIYDLVRGR